MDIGQGSIDSRLAMSALGRELLVVLVDGAERFVI